MLIPLLVPLIFLTTVNARPDHVDESITKDEMEVMKRRYDSVLTNYCGDKDLPDEMLIKTTECFSWRQELNQAVMLKCEDQAYGDATSLNARRRLHCKSKDERKRLKREFWNCYSDEAKRLQKSGGDSSLMEKIEERRRRRKSLTREEKKKHFKDFLNKLMVSADK